MLVTTGGVLLDSQGRLIGINAAIADPSGKGANAGELNHMHASHALCANAAHVWRHLARSLAVFLLLAVVPMIKCHTCLHVGMAWHGVHVAHMTTPLLTAHLMPLLRCWLCNPYW